MSRSLRIALPKEPSLNYPAVPCASREIRQRRRRPTCAPPDRSSAPSPRQRPLGRRNRWLPERYASQSRLRAYCHRETAGSARSSAEAPPPSERDAVELRAEHRCLRQGDGRLKKLGPHQLPARSDVLGIEFEHVVDVEEEHLKRALALPVAPYLLQQCHAPVRASARAESDVLSSAHVMPRA
jgi:hypothetical protein